MVRAPLVRGGDEAARPLELVPSRTCPAGDATGPSDSLARADVSASLVEFRWGTDVIRLEVEPDGDGTKLTLLDTIDQIGKAARDGAGWHVCLDLLEHHLDDATPTWLHGERWREVHPDYVRELGPETATIGPPAGVPA
jgi:hypothetical protein